MILIYCEKCSRRIAPSDVESGNVKKLDESKVLCPECAKLPATVQPLQSSRKDSKVRIPAARPSASHSSSRTYRPVIANRTTPFAKKALIAGIGILLLAVVSTVLLMMPEKSTKTAVASEPRAKTPEPTQPDRKGPQAVPASPAPVNTPTSPAPVKPPEPEEKTPAAPPRPAAPELTPQARYAVFCSELQDAIERKAWNVGRAKIEAALGDTALASKADAVKRDSECLAWVEKLWQAIPKGAAGLQRVGPSKRGFGPARGASASSRPSPSRAARKARRRNCWRRSKTDRMDRINGKSDRISRIYRIG